MKRMILTGILTLAAGLTGVAQQTPPPPSGQAPAGQAGPAVPQAKSPEELKAIQSVFASQDPDAVIKAAEDVLSKFADTQFKETLLTVEADAYQQKGDWMKAQITAERALEVNPKAIQPNMLVGEVIAAHTGERDLDKTEKLANAEKHLKTAEEVLTSGPKPNPQLTDAQWTEVKTATLARIHNDYGMIAINRKNWDAAITEFKAALEGDPQQGAYAARLASAYQSAGKNNEAIAQCDKMLADPQLHPAIKQFVNNVRAAAVKAGGQPATPPAAPPAEKK